MTASFPHSIGLSNQEDCIDLLKSAIIFSSAIGHPGHFGLRRTFSLAYFLRWSLGLLSDAVAVDLGSPCEPGGV